MPNTTYTPSWKTYEKDLQDPDADKALEAAEQFQQARQQELETSQQARDWEASRKAEWKKNKPTWKKQQLRKEQQLGNRIRADLLTGGTFETGLRPMPGYYLVLPDLPKEQTDAGIYLPDSDSLAAIPNTGTVLAVGDKRVDLMEVVLPPVEPGQHVLYKRGAGMELTLKDQKALIQQWTDILAIVEDEPTKD